MQQFVILLLGDELKTTEQLTNQSVCSYFLNRGWTVVVPNQNIAALLFSAEAATHCCSERSNIRILCRVGRHSTKKRIFFMLLSWRPNRPYPTRNNRSWRTRRRSSTEKCTRETVWLAPSGSHFGGSWGTPTNARSKVRLRVLTLIVRPTEQINI